MGKRQTPAGQNCCCFCRIRLHLLMRAMQRWSPSLLRARMLAPPRRGQGGSDEQIRAMVFTGEASQASCRWQSAAMLVAGGSASVWLSPRTVSKTKAWLAWRAAGHGRVRLRSSAALGRQTCLRNKEAVAVAQDCRGAAGSKVVHAVQQCAIAAKERHLRFIPDDLGLQGARGSEAW